jgi:hypothetical protein
MIFVGVGDRGSFNDIQSYHVGTLAAGARGCGLAQRTGGAGYDNSFVIKHGLLVSWQS